MLEQHLDIPTGDGAMNSFIVHPEEAGPHPAVLFYMDAPGKREELHDMARRIAAVGYYVVLPNLYYRVTREFTMVRSEDGYKRMFELMRGLSNDMVMRDTEAMLAFVDQSAPPFGGAAARGQAPVVDRQAAARRGPVGTVGYCMSGPFVFAAAARFPERVACSASIYGAGLVTDRPDSPHLTLSQIRGEIYFAVAEIDKYAPKPQIDALEAQLKASGINYRLEWYPGAEHGFAFPLREGIYNKPAAERHWERLFALFRRNIG